jgi:hypothetical protein
MQIGYFDSGFAGLSTLFYQHDIFAVNPHVVNCQPNSQEKWLPRVLTAWKPGWIFYSEWRLFSTKK